MLTYAHVCSRMLYIREGAGCVPLLRGDFYRLVNVAIYENASLPKACTTMGFSFFVGGGVLCVLLLPYMYICPRTAMYMREESLRIACFTCTTISVALCSYTCVLSVDSSIQVLELVERVLRSLVAPPTL